MTRFLFVFTLIALGLSPHGAEAACFADYKAKRDGPLRLHYGVMEIDIRPCAMSDQVAPLVAERLAKADWMLLQVRSVFEEEGLEERKRDAGRFFLRF